MSGWIKLHRGIKKHWIFSDPEKLKAWITIILEVNFEPKKVNIGNHLIFCDRGESVYSLSTWSNLFGWNRSKTRRFLKLLESDSMIVLKSTHETTHLTVCNYESYQSERNADETQTKRKRNASETQVNTTKESKESKESKEDNRANKSLRFTPPLIEEVQSYCKERENDVDPERWFDFYSAKNWMIGKNKMKDWKAAVRTWEKSKSNGRNNSKISGKRKQLEEDYSKKDYSRGFYD